MSTERFGLLILIDLVQDFDVLAPVLFRLASEPDLRLHVVVSRWLARRAPRIIGLLNTHRIPFTFVHRPDLLTGRAPNLHSVGAILTASETSASPHRWARALALRAKTQGLVSFTVQHGLDNLNVLAAPGPDRLNVVSDVFYCWPPQAAWPDGLDPELREKLVAVGRPMLPATAADPRFDLGVFENLHSKMYNEEQRRQVLADIVSLARARPNLRICVCTHPAGGWLDAAASRLQAFNNVTYISSSQARRSLAAPGAAVAAVARVITTPSTIALDAVLAGRPTALALDGGGLYAPLPVLRNLEDWTAFAEAPTQAPPNPIAFLDRHLVQGDAAGRVVAHLKNRLEMPVRC